MAKKQNPKPVAAQPVQRQQPQPRPATAAPKEPKPGMSVVRKLCIVLAIITAIVYVNTLQNEFVLDDIMVIKENRMVRSGLSGIGELLTTPHLRGHMNLGTDTYRPLSLVMYAIEFQFFGENATIGHFFNILYFIGCVLALFVFLDRLFDSKRTVVAFIAALLFAVHPIHVEVVANIKSRDELMCFFFAFLSLNLFLNYMKDGVMKWLLLGTLSMYLSFLSKETAITFLGVVPLVFFLYRNENKTRAALITAGTVVPAVIFLIAREVILNKYNANAPYVVKFLDNFLAGAPSKASQLATAFVLLGEYLKLMFLPYPLVCDHSFNSTPFVSFGNIWAILSVLLYFGMGIYSIVRLMKDRKDPWAFGMLFYLMTISLFSNLPFLVGAALADRFAFFASAGTCLIIALAIEKWVLKDKAQDIASLTSSAALGTMGVLAAIYGIMTYSRNGDWKDNYTLYKTDIEKTPNNTRMYYYLGAELQKQYDKTNDPVEREKITDQGVAYLRKSLEIYDKNTDSRAELGATFFRKKMYDSAIKYLDLALKLNPRQANASTNMGTVYMTQGKYAEALPYYKLTVSINPMHVLAMFNLGVCYYHTQKYDSSIDCFKKTIAVDPEYLNHQATQYTGIIYRQIGQVDSANKYDALYRPFAQQQPAAK